MRPGGLLDVAGLTAAPERFFARRVEQRGDPFCVRFPGLGNVLVTGHPDGAREIFSAPADAFVPALPNPVEPLLGSGSLILLGGERHRRERKLMTPPFHGDRMRTYGRIIQERSLEEMARWQTGKRIDISEAMRAITLDVIVRAVFGVRDPETRERIHHAIVAMLDSYRPELVALPRLRRHFGGVGPWARFSNARDSFRNLLRAEIAERQRVHGAEERHDVLTLLLEARYDDGGALSEEELLDELSTLLVAGHETSATALSWALYFVHKNPSLLDALSAELRNASSPVDPDVLVGLPLLGAVCNEALRLHPVVPIAIRRAARELSVRGVEVPAGKCVAVAVTLLHAHPDVWSEPERFRPDRFLTRKYSPFEYAPFGGGARRCVGAAFALYEMKIVLGTILAGHRLGTTKAAPRHRVIRNITMGPSRSILLRVES